MARIFHLADPDLWAAARATGSYEMSTRGRTLAEEGFIHCSEEHQWPAVRATVYDGVRRNLVLLEIDPELLDAPVVREVGDRVTGEEFPHVYGPVAVSAVVGTRTLPPPHDAQRP